MKTFIKTTVVYVSLFILLNSCSVYYKKEATFNEAYLSKKPVKLMTKDDRKVKLRKITYKDSSYYGVYYDNGNKIEFPMSPEKYKSLRIKDRTTSTVLNVVGITLSVGIVAIVLITATYDWGDFNFGNSGTQFKN